jgi:hypothetical protein
MIRALEVTHGPNGWHPHLHVLLLTSLPLSPELFEELREYLFGAWKRAVAKLGHDTPRDHCLTFTPAEVSAAEYVSKIGAALEITQGAQKVAKKGHRTPFHILADYLATGSADDLDLWFVYQREIKGARRLTWSHGLKARYAIPEVSDETLAAEEVGGEPLATFGPDEWGRIVATPGVRLAILEAAEVRGAQGIAWVLGVRIPPAPPPWRLSHLQAAPLGAAPLPS